MMSSQNDFGFGGNLFDTISNMPSPDEVSKHIQEDIDHHEEHLLLSDRIGQRYEQICQLLRENVLEDHHYPLGEEDMESLREFAGRLALIGMFKLGEEKVIETLRKNLAEATGEGSEEGDPGA